MKLTSEDMFKIVAMLCITAMAIWADASWGWLIILLFIFG